MKLCIVLDVDDDSGADVLHKSVFPYRGQLDSFEFGTVQGRVLQVTELPRVEILRSPGRRRRFGVGQ